MRKKQKKRFATKLIIVASDQEQERNTHERDQNHSDVPFEFLSFYESIERYFNFPFMEFKKPENVVKSFED